MLAIHVVWVIDALCGLAGLPRPLGVTAFLEHGAALDWWVQHTHFMLFIVLALDVLRHGALAPRAWMWASVLFTLLVALSRIALPPSGNVNMAWYPGEGIDFKPLVALAARWRGMYLVVVVDVVVLGLIVPTQWVIERWLGRGRRSIGVGEGAA